MVKKSVNVVKSNRHHYKSHKLQEKLIENLVELQKVHTDLAQKFDVLAKEISTLLELFESAAKQFAEQPPRKIEKSEAERDKEFLEKIDKLLEQNKLIARGLTLIEERMRTQMQQTQPTSSVPRELPREDIYSSPYGASSGSRPLPRF